MFFQPCRFRAVMPLPLNPTHIDAERQPPRRAPRRPRNARTPRPVLTGSVLMAPAPLLAPRCRPSCIAHPPGAESDGTDAASVDDRRKQICLLRSATSNHVYLVQWREQMEDVERDRRQQRQPSSSQRGTAVILDPELRYRARQRRYRASHGAIPPIVPIVPPCLRRLCGTTGRGSVRRGVFWLLVQHFEVVRGVEASSGALAVHPLAVMIHVDTCVDDRLCGR